MVAQFKSFGITLSIAFLLCAVILLSSVSTTNGQTEQRSFENDIPEHAPIRVQIKKEKEESFKDLANDKWVREFELEVTNIGDKPIFYLALVLKTNVSGAVLVPNSVRDGRFVFDVRYGKDVVGDIIITKAGADDVPIKPGETCTLKIDSREIRGWETSVGNGNHPQATKVRLIIQILSFGDGTGLFSSGATPYPSAPKRQTTP